MNTFVDFAGSTESARYGLPQADAILPPDQGISLLDAKNEIFLSYLQALALRNLHVIRSLRDGKTEQETQELNQAVTKKLVEYRVYLEKGVRPLEQKLQFQIDRVIQVANDEERVSQQKTRKSSAANGDKKAEQNGNSESEETSEDEEGSEASEQALDQGLHRPNAANFSKPSASSTHQERRSQNLKDDVYRPPRISATSMPTTDGGEPKERRAGRSATLDEYVRTELSHTPLAEPSIGSTITLGGRKNKDSRQLAKEQERREYEETNLTRLPKESKKERKTQQRRDRGGAFGGDEWRDLGQSVDRIGDLTRKKYKDGVLDKSRKRRAVEDGPRNDGVGDAFDLKKRRVMKKMRR